MNLPRARTTRGVAVAATLALTALTAGAAAVPALAEPADGPVTVLPSYTGAGGYSIGVDSTRGLVYMSNDTGVTVLDEATGETTFVTTPGDGYNLAVDQVTGYAYIPDGSNSDQITVMRAGELVGTVTATGATDVYDVTIDPVRHVAYVDGDTSVFVLKGTQLQATIPASSPYGATVNPDTGIVYAPNYSDSTVTVIKKGAVVSTVEVGDYPNEAAVDPLSGLVYVPNGDGTVSVLQGTRDTVVKTLTAGADDYGVVVDPVAHLAYVSNSGDDTITVIRGTKVIATLDAPSGYEKPLAVDPVNGIVLVVGSDTLTAIHGTTVVASLTTDPDAELPALDTVTGRGFVSADESLMQLQTPTVSSATIKRPVAGRVFRQGTKHPAGYTCTAGTNNTVTSCTAPVASGKSLPTGRVGKHTFRVRAKSAYGPAVVRTVTYRVKR